jgi:hypothetical protein
VTKHEVDEINEIFDRLYHSAHSREKIVFVASPDECGALWNYARNFRHDEAQLEFYTTAFWLSRVFVLLIGLGIGWLIWH